MYTYMYVLLSIHLNPRVSKSNFGYGKRLRSRQVEGCFTGSHRTGEYISLTMQHAFGTCLSASVSPLRMRVRSQDSSSFQGPKGPRTHNARYVPKTVVTRTEKPTYSQQPLM